MAGKERFFTARHAGVIALVAACVLSDLPAVAGAWAQSPDRSDIPRYTVFVAVKAPAASNRPKLRELLKADGYASHEEGEAEIALVLTEAEIRKLFQARVLFRRVEASASRGTVRQPFLENVTVPQRLRGLVGKVYFDPQRA
jgi:hypothetical protein